MINQFGFKILGNNTCKYTCWCVLYFNDFVFFPYILLSDTFLYSFTLFIIMKINLSKDRLMVFEVNILIKVIDIDHLELWETHCKSFSNTRTEKYLTFDIHITLCYYFLKIGSMWNWHTFPRLPSPILTLCRSKKNYLSELFFLKNCVLPDRNCERQSYILTTWTNLLCRCDLTEWKRVYLHLQNHNKTYILSFFLTVWIVFSFHFTD